MHPGKATADEIGDMRQGQAERLEADRRASMSERLARLHVLCKQMTAIKGSAVARGDADVAAPKSVKRRQREALIDLLFRPGELELNDSDVMSSAWR